MYPTPAWIALAPGSSFLLPMSEASAMREAKRHVATTALAVHLVAIDATEHGNVVHAARTARDAGHIGVGRVRIERPVDRAVAGDTRGDDPVVAGRIQAAGLERDLDAAFEIDRLAFDDRDHAGRTDVVMGEEIAKAAMFFATAPHFITGQILVVDGGLSL